MKGSNYRNRGVISQGIRTPVIKAGDDLQKIVISSVVEANGGCFDDGDIIGVTEAVVAIAQNNFVTQKDISEDIGRKFAGAKTLAIVDPIQSRNRFIAIPKAIAKVPTLEKIYIIMTYPSDEVGNEFITDIEIDETNINPYEDILTVADYYSKLGIPTHRFTGKNYLSEYLKACRGKARILLCNNFSKITSEIDCDDFLICSIHRREKTRKALIRGGAKRILDLSQIMNESVNGSGYNEEFGLYGSNIMYGDSLKLAPRDCQNFVEGIQKEIYNTYGKKVEVIVFGDGAFKDPAGGIWELADPTTTFGATERLKDIPEEVKLKYLASKHKDKSPEEFDKILEEERKKRICTEDIKGEASLGTTPRKITDIIASLSDLTTGSGDRQTPVTYIKNYF